MADGVRCALLNSEAGSGNIGQRLMGLSWLVASRDWKKWLGSLDLVNSQSYFRRGIGDLGQINSLHGTRPRQTVYLITDAEQDSDHFARSQDQARS